MHPLLAANEEWIVFASIIKEVSDRNWADEPVDLLHRRILRTLRKKSPITLASLARERAISRQHARKLVNQIMETGRDFVTTSPNPAHKTAPLVSLTDAGRAYIDKHDVEVSAFITELLQDGVFNEELVTTKRIIREIRTAMENWVVLYDQKNGNSDDELDSELPT